MEDKRKSGWYPGKYVTGGGKSRSSKDDDKKPSDNNNDSDVDESEESNKERKGWYPGKLMSKAARRVSVAASSSSATTSEYAEKKSSMRPVSGMSNSSEQYSELASELPAEKRKPQFDGLETIGKVRVRMPGIRYLNMTNATFIVELEDFAAFFDYNPDAYVEFDRTFGLKDISSDIVVTISGNSPDGGTITGIIVIPIVSLLGFNGTPSPVKEIWRQIYPMYSKTKYENFRFTSGFSEPQGYALTKPKQYIGFVSMINELNLYQQPLKTYFFGEPKFHLTEYVLDLLNDQESKNTAAVDDNIDETLSLALVNRNMQRLQNVMLPLTSLSPVLHLPEVFILVGVFGFFCFSLQVYQIPIFLFCFILFNGIYTMLNRSYSKVLIWNDSVFTSTSSPTPQTSNRIRSVSQADSVHMSAVLGQLVSVVGEGKMANNNNSNNNATQKTVYSVYSRHLHAVVHYLEILNNLFNFADSRVSIIFYVMLFAVAMSTSLFLALFSFRALLLIVVASILLLYAGRDVVYDYYVHLIKNSKESKAVKIMKHLTMLNCLMSKVPDELDLIHRYIAGTAIVNEKGAEMSDASIAFKK